MIESYWARNIKHQKITPLWLSANVWKSVDEEVVICTGKELAQVGTYVNLFHLCYYVLYNIMYLLTMLELSDFIFRLI